MIGSNTHFKKGTMTTKNVKHDTKDVKHDTKDANKTKSKSSSSLLSFCRFISPITEDDLMNDYELLKKFGTEQYIRGTSQKYWHKTISRMFIATLLLIPLIVSLTIPTFYLTAVIFFAALAAIPIALMTVSLLQLLFTNIAGKKVAEEFVKTYGLDNTRLNEIAPQRSKWIWDRDIINNGHALLTEAYNMFNAVLNGRKNFQYAAQNPALNEVLLKFKSLLNDQSNAITDEQKHSFLTMLSCIYVNHDINKSIDHNLREKLITRANECLTTLEENEKTKDVCADIRKEFNVYLTKMGIEIKSDGMCREKAVFLQAPSVHFDIKEGTDMEKLQQVLQAFQTPQESLMMSF